MNCPYCKSPAKLVDSSIIYGKSYGYAWVCSNFPLCDAYVGCHPKSKTALGSLADSELRYWRNRAHAAFDPLWQSRKMSRKAAYAWLSKALGIEPEKCHIGMFDIGQCKKVINLFLKKERHTMANNKPTMVTTGEVRISYEHLLKPYANQPGAEEKFSATLLIPKSDTTTKRNVDMAIQAAIQEGITSKWNGARPPQIAVPIYDGDGVRPNGEAFGEECKGHWVMTASSKLRQEIVDLNLQPIIDATQIYSGMYARVNINFFPYNAAGKRGVGCGLGPVQKTRDGEPLGGRISAADAFGGGAPDYPAQPTAQTGYSQQTYQQPPYSAQPQYPVQPQYQQPQYSAVDPITGQPMNPQSPPF